MNDCADSTTLRTHLDHPDAVLDAHLDECEACGRLIRSVAADAGFARRALEILDRDVDPAAVDTETALATALAVPALAPVVPLAPPARGSRSVARRLAVPAVAVSLALVAGLTPAGRAVAGVLDAFRGERLEVVTVDTAWASSFGPESAKVLETIGDLDTSGLAEPDEVADVREAEAVAGIDAPSMVGRPRTVLAMAPATARLVLQTRDGNGVPRSLDGAALIVDVPGAIGVIYGNADGEPAFVVGRSGPLVVRAEGAELDDIRSFILGREELPEGLRRQLASIGDWRSTVPVPVPVDGPGWKEVEVAGRQAIAFGDDSGLGALVLRQDSDGVTVVGGPIAVKRALQLAARV